ncbi:hypothetical protein QTH97_01780 [Variovorax sp. J22R24]|uniref:hypothetical protein n=1 Tax=Variovorax gracilis TaxID=3053502 RepID=UPI0025762603|nr:hypothetical protein [Variovorax sp. J22R24]MDM0103645.1 hypothetical protein [Variovorax sp. J22R24]
MSKVHRTFTAALGSSVSVAFAVSMLLVGCGGGGGSGEQAVAGGSSSGTASGNSNGTVKASNIVLKSGTQVAAGKDGFIRVQASQLPDNVKVLASNVSLENASNGLSASNLQDALDKEIAVNLSKTLVGVWDIVNLPGNTSDGSASGTCAMQPTGKVQINADGTFSVLNGAFLAAGTSAPDDGTCYNFVENKFEVVADGAAVMFTYAKSTNRLYPLGPGKTAMPLVVKSRENYITLSNGGQLSILKRSGTTQPVSAPAASQPVGSGRSLVAMAQS